MIAIMIFNFIYLATVSSIKPIAKGGHSSLRNELNTKLDEVNTVTKVGEKSDVLMSFKQFVAARTGELDHTQIVKEYELYTKAGANKTHNEHIDPASSFSSDEFDDAVDMTCDDFCDMTFVGAYGRWCSACPYRGDDCGNCYAQSANGEELISCKPKKIFIHQQMQG
jgi:hypothetical protein